MTNQESREVAKYLVKLIHAIDAIEKDTEIRDRLMTYCREMAIILKS
ncbi:MAG: hypothetical protein HQP61_02320 [Peptococcaceae bacterium]|nr:hypothetical protein [Candidatus Syntrophopropionicum ammoniitolerans]